MASINSSPQTQVPRRIPVQAINPSLESKKTFLRSHTTKYTKRITSVARFQYTNPTTIPPPTSSSRLTCRKSTLYVYHYTIHFHYHYYSCKILHIRTSHYNINIHTLANINQNRKNPHPSETIPFNPLIPIRTCKAHAEIFFATKIHIENIVKRFAMRFFGASPQQRQINPIT